MDSYSKRISKLVSSSVKYSKFCVESALARIETLNTCLSEGNHVLSEGLLLEIILNLHPLLMHDNGDLVVATAKVLSCTFDDVEFPQSIVLQILNTAVSALHSSTLYLEQHIDHRPEELLFLISNILDNSGTGAQEAFRESGALAEIINIFCTILGFEKIDNYLYILSNAVNVMIFACASPFNLKSKVAIARMMFPRALNFVQKCMDNESLPEAFSKGLKEVLFLCREIISESFDTQTIFLEFEGLKILQRALQMEDLMLTHFKIEFGHGLRMLNFDYSLTLSSSIVCLFDVTITHNNSACLEALRLNIDDLLKNYLFKVPKNQEALTIISSLAHMMEELESFSLEEYVLREMLSIARSNSSCNHLYLPTIKFIEEKLDNKKSPTTLKRNATSYLRRDSTETLCLESSETLGNMSLSFDSILEENLLPSVDQPTANSSHSPKLCTHFITTAELLFFMQCIHAHGINMKAVRNAFPFHEDLSPDDLYFLWRAIWNKY